MSKTPSAATRGAVWPTRAIASVEEAEAVLLTLASDRWICRGQDCAFGTLTPSLDRQRHGSRSSALDKERRSIDAFRAAARSFGPGEEEARRDDLVALAVLRHHGVPTRLLDWSQSPYVAAFFAVDAQGDADGELWAFDQEQYASMGRLQWERWPQTTSDGSGCAHSFDAKLTAFVAEEPPDWFCCMFYPQGFPRQNAQRSLYSLCARFGIDHADAIRKLLVEPATFRRWTIRARIKRPLLDLLTTKHNISRRSLFPDSAGAANTARREVFG